MRKLIQGVFFLTTSALAWAEAPQPEPMFQELDNYVRTVRDLLTPSSAAVVVSQGERRIHELYLPGSFEGLPPTDINARSLWPLASVTKSYTSAVLHVLVERGIVRLEDRVGELLPELSEPGGGSFSRARVTLHDLATHTSGLQFPDGRRDGDLASIEAVTAPGAEFRYSETGMRVLQTTLERVTGKSWPALLAETVLVPLGLNETRYQMRADSTLPLVPACAQPGSLHPHAPFFFSTSGSLTGSGLYATARDLNRFGQLWARSGELNGTRLFSPELAESVGQAHAVFDYNGANYGRLFWVFPDLGALVMSGATHSVCVIVPSTGTVVTVMRNYFGDIPDGFVFHQDKRRLAEIAVRIGQAATQDVSKNQ